MIRPHVDVGSAGPGNLLQLAHRSGRPSEVIQPADDFQHRCQRHVAGVAAEACVRAHAVVDVGFQRSVRADGVGRGEDLGVAVGLDLRGFEGLVVALRTVRWMGGLEGGREEGNIRNCRRLCRLI